jgi:hypothetical protein
LPRLRLESGDVSRIGENFCSLSFLMLAPHLLAARNRFFTECVNLVEELLRVEQVKVDRLAVWLSQRQKSRSLTKQKSVVKIWIVRGQVLILEFNESLFVEAIRLSCQKCQKHTTHL